MSVGARVLIVAGDPTLSRHLERVLRSGGMLPTLSATDEEPRLAVVAMEPGVDVPAIVRASKIPVVVAGEGLEVRSAVEAMRAGAVDVVEARNRRDLFEALDRALLVAAPPAVVERGLEKYGLGKLMSQSPRMLEVFDKIQAVAGTDATVLIRGETGTGKELVSSAIHARSPRRDAPMVAVNCGAFPESLLESELFGHERGSFTGAAGKREGVFEMADGGTLFLDELGETSANVQVSLLRVLEDFTFRRVGGRELVDVDVRIVAATHVDLEEAVEAGRFRQDLFYRLNIFPISLPPLRERAEDIPLLLRHFLEQFGETYSMEPPVVSSEALSGILAYHWPGNIRQLRAMCERWVITRGGARLNTDDLPRDMVQRKSGPRPGMLTIQDDLSMKDNTHHVVEQLERAYLYRQLRRHDGHLARTAEAAGITRRTLYTKMKQYDLDARTFRPGEST